MLTFCKMFFDTVDEATQGTALGPFAAGSCPESAQGEVVGVGHHACRNCLGQQTTFASGCIVSRIVPPSLSGPPYDKQRIQIGLRSANIVLIDFRSGVGHYQMY